MKIRSDFVTNSSSSSFGTVRIECKPLVAMLQQYKDLMAEKGLGEFPPPFMFSWDSDAGTVSWDWDEQGPSEYFVPHSIDEVLSSFFSAVNDYLYYYDDSVAMIGPLVRAIAENREDIETAITHVYWSGGHSGWGGDDDGRFDQGNYSADMLLSIKQSIADEKGCTVDEVSDRDFNFHVSCETSLRSTLLESDRAEELEEYSHDYYLL